MPPHFLLRSGPSSVVFAAFVLLTSVCSPAQAPQYSSNEVTVGIAAQTYGSSTCSPIAGTPFCTPGVEHAVSNPVPSFSYTRNLSPSLALEGTFQPGINYAANRMTDAGSMTLALGGVKTGWLGKRWGLYGRMQAGTASFSCGTWLWSSTPYKGCARTNFAMEYGGTVTYRVKQRYSLRLDAGHLQVAEFDQILNRTPSSMVYSAGGVRQHVNARIGISRSFGRIRDAEREAEPARSAWDAGVLFALQPRVQPDFQFLDPYPTWGIWASWNFSRHLSWDTALMHSGRNAGPTETIDYQAGGRAFEALTGVKAGIRRNHMGYFAKVHSGTITFGKTERQINRNPDGSIDLVEGMFTNFVLDTGGVIEVYPSRHSIIRFDVGSATPFYQPKSVISLGETYHIPSSTASSMLVSFGAGLRF